MSRKKNHGHRFVPGLIVLGLLLTGAAACRGRPPPQVDAEDVERAVNEAQVKAEKARAGRAGEGDNPD